MLHTHSAWHVGNRQHILASMHKRVHGHTRAFRDEVTLSQTATLRVSHLIHYQPLQ